MRVQRGVRRLAVVFLGSTTLVPVCVYGQNATWLANPGSGAFSTGTNWSSGAVPTGVASFGASSITTIGVAGSPTVNTLQFDAGAGAYTLDVNSVFTLQGSGVVNNSGQVQSLTVNGGTLAFTNSATAGDATLTNNGGVVLFTGTSSGGTARYVGTSGSFDISGLSAAGTTVGSIEGTGNFLLGSKRLTVGGNNLSTAIGSIVDGGSGGGTGGSLVKVGTGTLVLATTSNYTGGTTVSGGTLQGTTSSLLGAITNNANVTFDQATAGVYTGAMSGSGTLTKIGTGRVTLAGANSYSGGTIVNGGILAVGADNNLGLPPGGLTLNGGTLEATGSIVSSRTVTLGAGGGTFTNAGGNILQLNGTIGGSGGLAKTGTGALRLLGTNTYEGGTTVSGGGTLGIVADANLGSAGGGLTLSNGSTVQFDANMSLAASRTVTLGAGGGRFSTATGVDATIGGGVTGVGGLTKQGAGTLTLAGTNNYSGGTTVTAGTLQIGVSGGSAGSISGTMIVSAGAALNLTNAGVALTTLTNGGTLRFLNATSAASTTITNNSTTSFLGSSTAGSATINNIGTGALSFTETSSAGAATINTANGTVTRISDSASGGTASFIVNGTGRLDISGSTTGTTIGSVAGSGRLQLGGSQLTVGGNNLSTTMTGIISDGGDSGGTGGSLVKAGTGTLTLSGVSSYTGGTTVSGGTLQGTTATLQGNIVNNATVAFNQTITGTYASVMSGTGSVTKSGTGTVVLTGTNAYTGGTTLNAGTLQIGQGVTAGAIAGTVTVNGGALSIANANMSNTTIVANAGNTNFANASTAGNATLIVNSGALLQFLNNSTAGSARLIVNAGGIMATAGLASGGLTVGSIEGGGTFGLSTKQLVVGSNNLSTEVTGNLLGTTGSLVKVGSGTLTLSGTNTYTGGTTVAAGALQGNTTSLQGNITNNAAVVFDQATNATYAGTMSGTGSLTKQNSGTLIMAGSNSYSGGTTVNAGTVQGSTANLQGNITNNATVVFDQAANGTYAGNMSGTGSLTKQNTGTLIMAGINSYTGGTTVDAGILQGNTSSLQGNIVNNASVVFDQATNGTYAGNMSGTGTLTKSGAGVLTLSGNNTYTGATTVSGGNLVINGSFAGSLTIDPGGTLGGIGAIGSATINAGGTIAPGNSIGTLTVNGSFTHNAGSTYQVEVNSAGQSDRINVVGAPGTATINGGTVEVLAQAGTYARNTTYTILNATGGRTGTFSNVTSNFAFLTPSLSYDANNVYLLLFQTSGAFAAGAQTGNQFAVGTALDRASASATGDFNTVLNALSSLSTQQGPAALTAISGQQYSGFASANVSGGVMFMNVLGQQMSLARGGAGAGTRVALAEACDVGCDGAGPSPWGLWGSALGATGSIAGNNNSATLTYNAGGVSTGIDYRFSPNLLVGVGIGYTSGNQYLGGLSGRGSSDSYQASLYASFTEAAFYLDAQAGYGYNDNQMTRQIFIPGLRRARRRAAPAPTSSWARCKPATNSISTRRPPPR